jgi:hypothetical protein
MPIKLVDFPEPQSPESARLSTHTGAIESDAWRVLSAELDRYCGGSVRGRSFLISGHRGAGKTTLVLNAYQEVRKRRERRGAARPLLVMVNGPALFRAPEDGEGAPPADPPVAPPADPPVAPSADAREPWQHALKQIVLALHRAVAEEMCLSHRQRVIDGTPAGSALLHERLELSAQLEMELFECPMPARLRELWERAGLLRTGVLFQPGAFDLDARPDQGMRELVALAGVCEAYCRVSGTYTQAQKRSESAARQAEASLAASASPVVAPVVSLLAGGLVGLGAHLSDASGAASAAAGIGSALASAAVFRVSASRTSARSVSRELDFMPDLSVQTLDRFVPLLVDRLVRAGLPPVFLVDELDKVDDLPDRMVELLRQLKKVFAETAFFCFVTDRHYFEALRRITSDGAYPPSSTYFSDQLFVVYGHEDLHRYLRDRLEPAEAPVP